jgi:hypothetical protein
MKGLRASGDLNPRNLSTPDLPASAIKGFLHRQDTKNGEN